MPGSGPFIYTNASDRPARPMPTSPHISIYRFNLNVYSSIIPRMAGVFAYLAFNAFGWFAIYSIYLYGDLSSSVLRLQAFMQSTSYALFGGALFFFAFFFSFLLFAFAQLRHLLWDVGLGYSLLVSKITAALMFLFAFVIAVGIVFFLFF